MNAKDWDRQVPSSKAVPPNRTSLSFSKPICVWRICFSFCLCPLTELKLACALWYFMFDTDIISDVFSIVFSEYLFLKDYKGK